MVISEADISTYLICCMVFSSLAYEDSIPSKEEYEEALLQQYPLIDSEKFSFEEILDAYLYTKGIN